MKVKITALIAVALLIALSYLGKEGYLAAKAYEKSSYALSEMMGAENIAEYKLKELATILTLGIVKNDTGEKLKALYRQTRFDKRRSQRYILYYTAVAVALMTLFFFSGTRAYTFFISMGALISLVNGVITPVMMLTIHKKLDFVGDVVLSFESKAIMGSVIGLFKQGNLVIASTILIFSILLPFFKTASLLFLSLYETRPFAARLVGFFKKIGKWSMLDVFVVALLLVYMGSGNSDTSRAETEIGVYFFIIYVVLSVMASLSAEKMLSELAEGNTSKK